VQRKAVIGVNLECRTASALTSMTESKQVATCLAAPLILLSPNCLTAMVAAALMIIVFRARRLPVADGATKEVLESVAKNLRTALFPVNATFSPSAPAIFLVSNARNAENASVVETFNASGALLPKPAAPLQPQERSNRVACSADVILVPATATTTTTIPFPKATPQ